MLISCYQTKTPTKASRAEKTTPSHLMTTCHQHENQWPLQWSSHPTTTWAARRVNIDQNTRQIMKTENWAWSTSMNWGTYRARISTERWETVTDQITSTMQMETWGLRTIMLRSTNMVLFYETLGFRLWWTEIKLTCCMNPNIDRTNTRRRTAWIIVLTSAFKECRWKSLCLPK